MASEPTSIDTKTPLWGLRLARSMFGGYEEFSDPGPGDERDPNDTILLCHDCALRLYRFLQIPAAPVHHASNDPNLRCCEYAYLPNGFPHG